MRKITISIGPLILGHEKYGKCISMRNLFSQFPEVTLNPSTAKCAAIIKYAKEYPEDFFVENAISSISDYTCLKDGLLSMNDSINKVIVSYPKLLVNEEYERLYNLHGRWMDYSPEAAKQIAKNHIENLKELAEYIKQDNIEVEVVVTDSN